jgi:hypothetical protein
LRGSAPGSGSGAGCRAGSGSALHRRAERLTI